MQMIGEIIGAIAQNVPPWALAIGVLVLVVLLGPGWLTGTRVKRVKSLLRRTVRAEGEARQTLLDEAWETADGRGEVLIALVREADKLNLPILRDRALDGLEALGTYRDEVRKLRRPADLTRERAEFSHPVEAVVLVERLLENGANEAARERLDEALRRFPDDPGLRELMARLDASPGV